MNPLHGHPPAPLPAVDDGRRRFLVIGTAVSGGLLVGCAPSDRTRVGSTTDLPALDGTAVLNAWVRIGTDGQVTVALPRAEMGQGIGTALPMLVAEELDADWSRVRTEQAPIERVYANTAMLINVLPFGVDDDHWVARAAQAAMRRAGHALNLQVTGGSSSIRDAWEPLRLAGAAARGMLVHAAALNWKVPESECTTKDGIVLHAASGRSARYGELAAKAATLDPVLKLKLKDPAAWRLIGQPVARLDIPAKVNGQARFGIDAQVPGMVHAFLRMPEVIGSGVQSYDAAAIQTLPGVFKVVQVPQGVAVLADRWWTARQAAEKLPVTWTTSPHATLSSTGIRQQLDQALKTETGTRFRREGDGADALPRAGRRLQATYWAPFLAHAALEPINCTAQVKGGKVTLWCGTQSASLAVWRAAQIAGVDTRDVTLHLSHLGGGFGRRLEIDMVEQAVAIALQADGRPVKLLWTREQDTRHDVYRPCALARFEAGIDEQGRVSVWTNTVAAPSVSQDATGRLLPWAAADSPDKSQIEGAFDLPYRFPHLEVRQVRSATPVPIGFWRSVGHSHNAFFTEGFMDELAHELKQDPLKWRLSLLTPGSRHFQVLEAVQRLSGWDTPPPKGRARGVALHESFGAICAQVAEVSVNEGQVKVHRVSCAFDCGVVVNPDTVKAQVEGSVMFGLSAALQGEITVQDGRVVQGNFSDYEILRLRDMPVVDVALMVNAHAPGGVGEPATPPIAPAVANALFTLTGQRIRELPIRLKKA